MEILELGTILVIPVFSFLNHDRVADLADLQLSSSVSDSLTIIVPVMFTCKGTIYGNNSIAITAPIVNCNRVLWPKYHGSCKTRLDIALSCKFCKMKADIPWQL